MSSVTGALKPPEGQDFAVSVNRFQFHSGEESYTIEISEFHEYELSSMCLGGSADQLKEVARRIQAAVSLMESLPSSHSKVEIPAEAVDEAQRKAS